ncbi:hypothetical protein [Desulfolutivibrio sp.]|uniref:hypothetical protein n=1 Tax=Desulfolutivibrio sp. TaxID=2773296 RepID=UPI002F967524
MFQDTVADWVDEASIRVALESGRTEDAGKVRDILAKALELKGLRLHDVAEIGKRAIAQELDDMLPKTRRVSQRMIEKVRSGRRDVSC